MKKFFKEFKDFALRGNVLDMAVGVLIGGALTAVVTALTNNILSPIIGLFAKANFDSLAFTIGDVTIQYGAFITAIINFIIIAFVAFLIVRTINKISSLGKHETVAPTTKECPYCFSSIPIKATRCPNCTSQLEAPPPSPAP